MTRPDSAVRLLASAVIVACVVALVLLAAAGCRDFEGYVAISLLAIMSAFVALTQES